MVWCFSKNKMLFFFLFILDRIVSAGRCSRDILTFSNFVSKQVTFPLVFFDPHHAPRQISKHSFFLFYVSKQITNLLVFFWNSNCNNIPKHPQKRDISIFWKTPDHLCFHRDKNIKKSADARFFGPFYNFFLFF